MSKGVVLNLSIIVKLFLVLICMLTYYILFKILKTALRKEEKILVVVLLGSMLYCFAYVAWLLVSTII